MWLLCDAPPWLVHALIGAFIGTMLAILWRTRHW